MVGIGPAWRDEMQNQKPILFQIRDATLACRKRNNDKSIGTSADQGLLRVERVTYAKNGISTINPLSDWLPIADAISFLNEYSA